MRYVATALTFILVVIGSLSHAANEKTVMLLVCQQVDNPGDPDSRIPGVYIFEQVNSDIYDGHQMITTTTKQPSTKPVPFRLRSFLEDTLEVPGKGYTEYKSRANHLLNGGGISEDTPVLGMGRRVWKSFGFEVPGITNPDEEISFSFRPDNPSRSSYLNTTHRPSSVVVLHCDNPYEVPEVQR